MLFPPGLLGSILDANSGAEWLGDELYGEVLSRVQVLSDLGIGRNQIVAIMHGGTLEFFADLLAVWQVGGCAACLNPDSTQFELDNISALIKPAAILISQAPKADIQFKFPIFSLASKMSAQQSPTTRLLQSDNVDQNSGALDDDALILFTSGTTGPPKGVVHTFRSLIARTTMNRKFIGDSALHTTMCVLPSHFGHGLIGNCLTPLFAGARLILYPGGAVQVAAGFGKVVDDNSVTFMSSVPSFWKLAFKVGAAPSNETLKRIHVGSAPLSKEVWQEIIEWSSVPDVVNMYGITETANWIAGASSLDNAPTDGLIGRMWGGAAQVLTEDGKIKPVGEGELIIQSPSLMRGYYQRDDLTHAALQNGWYRTGDIGRIDDDGLIRLTGRAKSEINRAGLKIHPEEIDTLLERHDFVQEACTFAIPDNIAGEIVGIAIVMDEGKTIELEDLRKWCLERLVREKVPERWFVVSEIPKTDRGKINRSVVAAYCLNDD